MFFLLQAVTCLVVLPHEEKSFVQWMRSTNQMYTGDEYNLRLGIYLSNARLVQQHNAKGGSYRLGLNKFAAMTPSEYQSMLGYKPTDNFERPIAVKSSDLNITSLDWREKGGVTTPKDQQGCGSSWAFAAICGCEGANFVATGTLLEFSVSNLLDCVTSCYGCYGGMAEPAITYIINKQGGQFNLESDYPYKALTQSCVYSVAKAVGKISGYISVVENDEDDLAAKCAEYGPCCVVIDSHLSTFQFYESGIYDDEACSKTDLNHPCGCVGFGENYWIVKNCWGTTWGEEGYMRLLWKKNHCGIATMAIVPV